MTATADASFLVSLYGVDVNTPAARAWMVANAQPILLTGALRFETENALRLACFRGRITATELAQALLEIESDLVQGILIPVPLASDLHWEACRRISAAHTLSTGSRAYDITHIAAALVLRGDTFLSFDHKQRTLAGMVGLNVVP
jgi:predicted nucleic acid-binding protein